MPTSPSVALRTSVLAALAVGLLVIGLPPAEAAAAAAKHFTNCAQLQQKYPHGVGKSGAKDKTSGRPVKNFRVDTALYQANDGPRNASPGEYDLDRDNDGVACEKL